MRLKELDFLRGVAIILVLFRHHWMGIDALQHIGWVGVDLFFVLSGFLVSGLLFKEHKETKKVERLRFLIRRGFKIYPMFYLSLLITFLLSFFISVHPLEGLNWKGKIIAFLPEIFFVQNYLGFIWGHHWSLAIEEHFYLLLALFFPLVRKHIKYVAPVIFLGCLAMRIYTPEFAPTHLRIDSLFAGVCVAYAYYHGHLRRFHEKYRPVLICLCYIPLLFMFTDVSESYLELTIGLTMLYISFASLLIVFLYGEFKVNKWIAKVGFYSYGIYLFHLYWMKFVLGEYYQADAPRDFTWDVIPSFLIYFIGSISLGMAMSWLVERPFLKLRDKLVPKNRDKITV